MKVISFTEGSAREDSYMVKTYRNGYQQRRSAKSDRIGSPSRVFVRVQGENLLDDFGNRTSRPYNVWKQPVLDALRSRGVNVEKLRWSQKAGCTMCPCSPGFIIDGETGHDYFMTIDAAVPQVMNPDEANHRLQQLGANLNLI